MPGIETDVVVDFDDFNFGLTETAAEFGVEIVGIGNDGVEAVVAAVHFDDDEDVFFAGFGGHRGASDELRGRRNSGLIATRPGESESETCDG